MGGLGRRLWIAWLALLVVTWATAAHVPLRAAEREQIIIVGPENISTPTPWSAKSLLPTPTPSPTQSAATTTQTAQHAPDLPANAAGNGNVTYIVKPRDTVWSVSLELGIDLEDVPCAVSPTFQLDMPLVIGDRLAPLPAGVRCHRVAEGETLQSIAALYSVSVESIVRHAWNGLSSGDELLVAGTHLRIPAGKTGEQDGAAYLAYLLEQPVDTSPFVGFAVGGSRPSIPAAAVPPNWPYGSGAFIWPTSGWLSQGYRLDHRAVDIAAPLGTYVQAADRGVVIRAGWNTQGYGLFVVIDHNIDYMTLYAHLDEIFVKEGQVVGQGEVLGTVGSTGNSTGPHLHFEIRDFGRRVNPAELLMRVAGGE